MDPDRLCQGYEHTCVNEDKRVKDECVKVYFPLRGSSRSGGRIFPS